MVIENSHYYITFPKLNNYSHVKLFIVIFKNNYLKLLLILEVQDKINYDFPFYPLLLLFLKIINTSII